MRNTYLCLGPTAQRHCEMTTLPDAKGRNKQTPAPTRDEGHDQHANNRVFYSRLCIVLRTMMCMSM